MNLNFTSCISYLFVQRDNSEMELTNDPYGPHTLTELKDYHPVADFLGKGLGPEDCYEKAAEYVKLLRLNKIKCTQDELGAVYVYEKNFDYYYSIYKQL
jgi:hypothetical protein